MILKRSREMTINLGNNTYESARIGAEVNFDTETVTSDFMKSYNVSDAYELADAMLTEALASEVKYFHELTLKKDSAVHLVHEDNEKRS